MAKISEKKPHITERSKARMAGAILAKYIEAGEPVTKAQILREAGYAPSVVDRGQSHKTGTPWTSEAFRDTLERSGLGIDKLKQVLNEAMEAKTVAVYQGSATETDAPDHAIRLKAVKQIADISGLNIKRSQSLNVSVEANPEQMSTLLGI